MDAEAYAVLKKIEEQLAAIAASLATIAARLIR